MIIKQSLIWATNKLQDKRIDSAYLDAEILLSYVLKRAKEFLYTYPNCQLTKEQVNKYKKLINKRKKFEPIAYLIGYKEFYGLQFKVSKDVLIPRPQSEEIIDKALEIIKKQLLIHHRGCRPAPLRARLPDGQGAWPGIHDRRYQPEADQPLAGTICDIGTGSGCLIITLAKKLQELKILNRFKLLATDISKKALTIAKKNAKLHLVEKKIKFYKGNLLKPLKNKKIDLIIANLPYLSKDHLKKERSIQAEPKIALSDNKHYYQLFNQISQLKFKLVVIFENNKGVWIKNQTPAH